MTDRNVAVNRTLAGVLAILCAIAGVLLLLARGIEDQFAAGFIRVSLVLAALWWAMPSRTREAAWARVSPWTVAGVLLVAVFLVRQPRVLLPVVVILAIVGYFLRPRRPPSSR